MMQTPRDTAGEQLIPAVYGTGSLPDQASGLPQEESLTALLGAR